ncbi:MAG: helix-turn-helix domain-containing protein, partial [Mucinivorans sp.]
MLSFIGKLINQMRQESSIPIEELSSRTGISSEKLQQIESGVSTPSIGVLIKISRALGSRLGTLLDGQETFGAVVTRASQAIPSKNFATQAPGEHMDFYSLAQGKNDRHMEPLIVEVKCTEQSSEVRSEHEGEEFLYVLEGQIEVHYGAEVHLLG